MMWYIDSSVRKNSPPQRVSSFPSSFLGCRSSMIMQDATHMTYDQFKTAVLVHLFHAKCAWCVMQSRLSSWLFHATPFSFLERKCQHAFVLLIVYGHMHGCWTPPFVRHMWDLIKRGSLMTDHMRASWCGVGLYNAVIELLSGTFLFSLRGRWGAHMWREWKWIWLLYFPKAL